LLIFLSFDL
jgi:hypothetical protein